jgi:hypothetical protein
VSGRHQVEPSSKRTYNNDSRLLKDIHKDLYHSYLRPDIFTSLVDTASSDIRLSQQLDLLPDSRKLDMLRTAAFVETSTQQRFSRNQLESNKSTMATDCNCFPMPTRKNCSDCASATASASALRHALQTRTKEDNYQHISELKRLRETHATKLAKKNAELESIRTELAGAQSSAARRAPMATPGMRGLWRTAPYESTQSPKESRKLREIRAQLANTKDLLKRLERERACEHASFADRVYQKLAPLGSKEDQDQDQDPKQIPLPESRESADVDMAGLEACQVYLPQSPPNSVQVVMANLERDEIMEWRELPEVLDIGDDEDDLPALKVAVNKAENDDIEVVMLDSNEGATLDKMVHMLASLKIEDADVDMVDSDEEEDTDSTMVDSD